MFGKANPTASNAKSTALWALINLAVIVGIVFLLKLGFDWLSAKILLLEAEQAQQAMWGLTTIVLICYALLIAVPFVPGVEIGVAVLMIQGAQAAPLVYGATVLGMVLSFSVGQYMSLDWMITVCNKMRLVRLGALLQKIKEKPRTERLASLEEKLPNWLTPFLTKYRYITVAIVINTPGSIAIGGGGGIMMVSGISRLFKTRWMILTIALSTLPIPLTVWVLGIDILS